MLQSKPKLLTVGDGDLSLSLAIRRAYGQYVDVTSSVIESERSELQRIFPEAPLDELESSGVQVLYGVDATQLHCTLDREWDLISFHHPHLGISNVENCDESIRSELHHRLLCHYLYSAKQVSKRVHVCLTGTQPHAWKLMEAATRQNLRLVKSFPDSKPFAQVWTDSEKLPEAAQAEPKFAAPRKYRNGKLGRHFLARYGYRHRRTEGVLFQGSIKDANVSESTHFIFEANQVHQEPTSDENTTTIVCSICNQSFDTESTLEEHLKCPVRPPAIPEEDCDECDETTRIDTESNIPTDVNVPAESKATKVEQCFDDQGGTILTVPSSSDGKRLRWFLQHANLQLTKRLAESTIQAGFVSVNGQVAKDSSRILKNGDTITIQQTTQDGSSNALVPALTNKTTPTIEIAQRSPPTSTAQWLVAIKPSGMRTKGKFPGTLESIVCQQEGKFWSCISSLETSCSGLCVLVVGNTKLTVLHTMTVLVHGHLANDEWGYSRDVELVQEQKWRKKKKRKLAGEIPVEEPEQTISARIHLQETTSNDSLALSTLQVTTSEPSSSSICHYFRQTGYPVVGDAFCKQEYLKLKRSIRNRIKNKLCVGCHKVEITAHTTSSTIEIQSPNKLSAAHWEKFLTTETIPPSSIKV